MITDSPFEIRVRQKSYSKDAVLTTSYADDYITRGRAFQVRRRISIAAATTVKIVLDTSAVTAGYFIYILPITMGSTGGPVNVDTYKITSYTGGDAIIPAKVNAAGTITALSVFKTGITSTDTAGNDLRQYVIGGTGNPQQVARGGAGGAALPTIFPAGSIVVMEIANQYTDTVSFVFDVSWYELPPIVADSSTAIVSPVMNSWTALTSAGQAANIFLQAGNEILVDHSASGTSGCSATKARIMMKNDTYQQSMYLMPSSDTDIFYAMAMTGAEKVVVDIV